MKVVIVVLALTALLKFGDAAITAWNTPPIASAADGTGTLHISDSQATGTTIETYEAVTDNPSITGYSINPPVSPFTISATGELSITSSLDADTTASYTLNIEAVDNATTPATGIATITVTVTDLPVFGQTSYAVCIEDGSTTGATLITVLATDTGDTLTHSIASGNTNTDYTIVEATGVITVNTGKTLSMSSTSTYALVIRATDDETPNQTGSTTVNVTVNTNGICSSAAAVTVSIMTILMTLIVTM